MRARIGGIVLCMSLFLLVASASSAVGQEGYQNKYPTDLRPYPAGDSGSKKKYAVPVLPKELSRERESQDRSWGEYFEELFEECIPLSFGIKEESDKVLREVCDELVHSIGVIPTAPDSSTPNYERLEEGMPGSRPPENEGSLVVPEVLIPSSPVEY